MSSSANDQSSKISDDTAGDVFDELERHLFKQLRELDHMHALARQPIVDELVRIQMKRPPAPIFLDYEAIRTTQAPAVSYPSETDTMSADETISQGTVR